MDKEQRQAKDQPGSRAAATLRVLLSSSLAAALIGLVFSLFGLLYRAGYLQAFGVAADAFLPSSSAELSYWGYIAVLEAWYSAYKTTSKASFQYLVIASAAVGVLIALIHQVLGKRRETRVRMRLLKQGLRKSSWASEAIGSIGAFAVTSLIPWLVVTLAAFVIGLPLVGFRAGQRHAEQALEEYARARAGNTASCYVLSGLREPASDCLFVIAHTKERVVFADGERVKIVPAEGVEISWTPSKLRNPAADR